MEVLGWLLLIWAIVGLATTIGFGRANLKEKKPDGLD